MKHAPSQLGPMLLLILVAGHARAEPAPQRADANVYGELQAATAATHQALLHLSPMLSELWAAYHVVLAQGQLPSARSDSPIEPRLRRHLNVLARRAQARADLAILPPLARVYHSRANAALTAVGNARLLGELLGPSRSLLDALTHLQAAERDLVWAQAESQAPKKAAIDPVWPGPLDEPIARLQRLVAAMGEPPRPLALDAQVELAPHNGDSLKATISWTPPSLATAAGLTLEVCRTDPLGPCTAAIDPLAGHYKQQLPLAAWYRPPAYRISTLSPFGVHSRAHEHPARLAGGCVPAPTQVMAVALAPAADSQNFYRLMDAVLVSWKLSESDRPELLWDEALQQRPPHRLRGYAIYRLDAQAALLLSEGGEAADLSHRLEPWRVGEVAPGVDHYTDRAPVIALQQGLHYAVLALTDPRDPGGPPLCVPAAHTTAFLQADIRPSLRLASQGAAAAHQPLLWEQGRTRSYNQDPQALQRGISAITARTKVMQRALWEGFWRSTPPWEREIWWHYHEQPQGQQEADQLRQGAAHRLSEDGLQGARLALYIEAHQDVAAAIAQHWALLDEADKKLAAKTDAWPLPPPATAPKRLDAAASWPIHVAAWWHSRDQAQRGAIDLWWRDLLPEVQQDKLAAWLAPLSDDQLRPLVWPPWYRLTPQEQRNWLEHAPQEVEPHLWPRFLAHIDFESLPLQARVAAVRADVGVWQSFMAQSRFALRPLDKLLHFNLWVALTFVGLGLLSGYLVGFAHGRPGNQGFD